jgi:DNA-binding winged helix-turn-helix (wHTH) protein
MVQPKALVQPQITVFRIGEFRIDPALDEISKEGTTTKLEPRTMRLLVCLAERAGQVVSVEQLLDLVWKDVVVSPDSVYQAVASLRRILGDDPKAPKYIANVMRRGYRLIAAVLPEDETTPPSPRTASQARRNNPRMATVALACIVVLSGSFAAWRELHGTARAWWRARRAATEECEPGEPKSIPQGSTSGGVGRSADDSPASPSRTSRTRVARSDMLKGLVMSCTP